GNLVFALSAFVPQRHEPDGEKREHCLTALVGAAVAGLDDSPFGTRLRDALGLDLARKGNGVAGQHRLDPAELTKAWRGSSDRDLLAARGRFAIGTLGVSHQELHVDGGDVPARRRKPAEQRVASLFLGKVKALRIELPRKALDVLGGEGERAQFTPLAERKIFEEAHQPFPAPSRRLTMIGDTISHSTCPRALRAMALKVMMPVSGRLLDTRASVTSTSSVKSSPGRSGASQRNSLTPGEPSEAVRPMKPSNIIRIISEQRCQPEPASPLSIERLAASSSRCIGCGSNSAAKAKISSRETCRGPNVPKRPGWKSSKVSMAGWGLWEGKPDCGRTLQQSQAASGHDLSRPYSAFERSGHRFA